MKLEKFNQDKKNKIIAVAFLCTAMVFTLIGIIIHKTFASFQETKTFNIIEGTVKYEGTGDVIIAAYIDGVKTDKFPSKADYTYDAEQSNCTNDAILNFDINTWKAAVSEVSIPNTKCNLYFVIRDKYDNLIYKKMVQLAETDTTNLAYDGTVDNNLRYIGANPDNYVTFNGELWRIIGSFNNIDDGTGRKEWRTKIIKEQSIGNYSWDTSNSNINSGYGVNDWSNSEVMAMLNTGTYWSKLEDTSKELIDDAVWNLGSNGTEVLYNDISTSKFYELERGKNTGKICFSGPYCNDNNNRMNLWTGKIGLMYPSDYGYAVGGDSRTICLNTILESWTNINSCYNENWVYNASLNKWTITPCADTSYASRVFLLHSNGGINGYNNANGTYAIYPTLYLSTNAYITGGTGTSTDPYQLGLQ